MWLSRVPDAASTVALLHPPSHSSEPGGPCCCKAPPTGARARVGCCVRGRVAIVVGLANLRDRRATVGGGSGTVGGFLGPIVQ